MKRLIGVLLIIIVFCWGGITAFADTAMYETAGDLYQAWYGNMPDYVCGVWSTDGSATNLTFGIQDTDEGDLGKQEILDLIADDSTVSFVYQKYSENYLNQIQEEIFPYFEKNLGLVSSGVYVMENHVGVEIHKDFKENAETKEMIAELKAKYGDAIYIDYAEGYVTATLDTVEEIGASSNTTWILAVAALILLSIMAVFAVSKSRTAAMQTNTGTVISGSSGYSTRAVEGMVKESAVAVPSELYARVMESINDTE